jgi:osmotically-inducible protein OsmY
MKSKSTTLKGDAEWDYQRNAAKDAVSQLMGVCGIANNISVRSKIQPSDIQNRIEEALKRSAVSEGHQISVSIKGDKAILAGKVHSFGEFEDAGRAAWMAPGIMAVENNITISR